MCSYIQHKAYVLYYCGWASMCIPITIRHVQVLVCGYCETICETKPCDAILVYILYCYNLMSHPSHKIQY